MVLENLNISQKGYMKKDAKKKNVPVRCGVIVRSAQLIGKNITNKMKSKCLKSLLSYTLSFLFLGLLFLFLPLKGVNADTLMIQHENQGGCIEQGYFGFSPPASQTFTATNDDSLTKIQVYYSGCSTATTYGYICEVSSPSSYTCLDTPLKSTNGTTNPDDCSFAVRDFNFTGWDLQSGHYYMFQYSGSADSISSPSVYAYTCNGSPHLDGGQFSDNGAYDYYYFDVYTSPSTYCGDTVCNGAEDYTNCPTDCPPPTPQGYVFWAGTGGEYAIVGGQWKIPFYWDFCNQYDNITGSVYALAQVGSDTLYKTVIQDKSTFIGAQKCRGYDFLTGAVTNGISTGTTNIELIDRFTSPNIMATSSAFTYHITTGAQTDNYLDIIDKSPVYVASSTATTTDIRFSYNFQGMVWASSTVCAYNFDTKSATSFCVPITEDKGASQITIANENNNYKDYQLILYSSGGEGLLFSNPFVVVWYNVDNGYKDMGCNIPPLDVSHSCDNLDLTTEGTFGIAWGQVGCAFVQAGNVVGYYLFTPNCGSLNYFKSNYDLLKQGFPFNVYFDFVGTINNAIDNSTATTSTTTLSMPFIHRIGATSTEKFTMLPVLKNDSISNAIGSDNSLIFRRIQIFIIWILVGLLIFFTIRKV